MTTLELQNTIIRKVLEVKDPVLLDFVMDILDRNESTAEYQFTNSERKLIEESLSDYSASSSKSHDEVINRMDSWLKE
jgi:hypothetical protein